MSDPILLGILLFVLMTAAVTYGVQKYFGADFKMWFFSPMSLNAVTWNYFGGVVISANLWPWLLSGQNGPQYETLQVFLQMAGPASIVLALCGYYFSLKKTGNSREWMICLAAFITGHGTWLFTSIREWGVNLENVWGCVAAFPIFWAIAIAMASSVHPAKRARYAVINYIKPDASA